MVVVVLSETWGLVVVVVQRDEEEVQSSQAFLVLEDELVYQTEAVVDAVVVSGP